MMMKLKQKSRCIVKERADDDDGEGDKEQKLGMLEARLMNWLHLDLKEEIEASGWSISDWKP